MKSPVKYGVVDARALRTLTRLASEAAAPPVPAEVERGLRAVRRRMAARQHRSRRVARWLAAALAALAVGVCAVVALQWVTSARARDPGPRTIGYRLEGGNILEGGYLRATGVEGMQLLFEDTSRVILEANSRARLRSADVSGGRVVIEQGTASFEVATVEARRWVVEAGPFSVAVPGTQFTVSWSPSSEHFELGMIQGSAVVSGPMIHTGIELRAGQRMVVDLSQAMTVISEDTALPTRAGDTPELLPEAVPLDPVSLDPVSTEAASPDSNLLDLDTPDANLLEPKNSEVSSDGDWDLILDEVERGGTEASLELVSSDDLFELADAARQRRRLDLARAAFLAQRRRFPEAARSVEAAFWLGRLAEPHDKASAIEWYAEYLARAGHAVFAAEASGRKMMLVHELKGCGASRALAGEYLRRFPEGSYAAPARGLCRAP